MYVDHGTTCRIASLFLMCLIWFWFWFVEAEFLCVKVLAVLELALVD